MMEKGKMERGVVELVDTESLVPQEHLLRKPFEQLLAGDGCTFGNRTLMNIDCGEVLHTLPHFRSSFYQLICQPHDLRGQLVSLLLCDAGIQRVGDTNAHNTDNTNDNAGDKESITPHHRAAHPKAHYQRADNPDNKSRCQRQFEIVRKRRRNFVVFRRGGNKTKRFLAQKECSRFAVSDA